MLTCLEGQHSHEVSPLPISYKEHSLIRLSPLQGLKMTDGLYSLRVCNDSMIDVHSSYPYRSYELLTVEVGCHSTMQLSVSALV